MPDLKRGQEGKSSCRVCVRWESLQLLLPAPLHFQCQRQEFQIQTCKWPLSFNNALVWSFSKGHSEPSEVCVFLRLVQSHIVLHPSMGMNQ